MIERLYLKNHLSFKECELFFSGGLIAFTGPSGAGKSVFMQALLSLFGYVDAYADVVEATLEEEIDVEPFGIEKDSPTVLKMLKGKSARYFVNAQNVSRKTMVDISKTYVNYLSVKDGSEFENSKLLALLDALCFKENSLHVEEVERFKEEFSFFEELEAQLDDLTCKEQKIEELKEFARFEISKIDEISPKIGEDEELMSFKKTLSKKEKLEQAIASASAIFSIESSVCDALRLMEKGSAFFDEAMNELRAIFEKESEKLGELEDINIEELLERIEKLASLKKRYGSIELALAHKKTKEEELKGYENLSFEKEGLQKKVTSLYVSLSERALILTKRRQNAMPLLMDKINQYLAQLYMNNIELYLDEVPMFELGCDSLRVELGAIDVKKLSSGEYNRLRLALIATQNDLLLSSEKGVLILDEIDANLSGKESMSVAKVLKKLSKKYQIFAISHQPQLSSLADLHYCIEKSSEGESSVKLLNETQRVVELARMVSGEHVSEEATRFAKTLLASRDL
ncbi:MAG: chromosome segregation protein SMC [Sulfurospirillaceae bacterium]|nr:chromosome segregation protein SMC [Sulfurospirillaceae bacterium]